MAEHHILVVDDDPAILEFVARALAAPARRVSAARRGAVARDMLARASFDLVLTDARLPGETGLALAALAAERGIAALVMSGEPEWAAEHGLASGEFLAKPFDRRLLLQRVEACLGAVESAGSAETYAQMPVDTR